MSLLSGEHPVTELLSTVNSTKAPSLLSLPWRARLNCQTSTELTHSPNNFFTQLNRIARIVFFLTPWHGPHRKHSRFHSNCIVCISFPRERVYRAVAQKRTFVICRLHSNDFTCYNIMLLINAYVSLFPTDFETVFLIHFLLPSCVLHAAF
jgi:hypothetical protein